MIIAEANVPVADPFASAASSGAFGSWRRALGFPCLGNAFQIYAGQFHDCDILAPVFHPANDFINFVSQETLEESQSHSSKLYPGFSPEHRLSELPASDKALAV